MEPGRYSDLSVAMWLCWYCECVPNLLGQFVVSILGISIIRINVLSCNFMINKFSDVLPYSLQFFSHWSSVSVILSIVRTITFNASKNRCV